MAWNNLTSHSKYTKAIFCCNPLTPGGRGLLSIFVRRGCAVFQGIVFAYFSRTGYQKKANFLEQVFKNMSKEESLLQRVIT